MRGHISSEIKSGGVNSIPIEASMARVRGHKIYAPMYILQSFEMNETLLRTV